ncbi:MAG: membrane protein required for colicin V production [Flavobacterium sp.]|jgi:membrane protein required for colicin V production
MGMIDIVLGVLLALGIFKGIKNGLIVEFASLISFFAGIYIAVKFSNVVGAFIGDSKTAKVFAFILTFILVVVGIFFLAKILSKVASALFLGILNRIGGAVFGVLKTALVLGVILSLFQKINLNDALISKETQENSLFFNPILKTSEYMLPVLTEWFLTLKEKVAD